MLYRFDLWINFYFYILSDMVVWHIKIIALLLIWLWISLGLFNREHGRGVFRGGAVGGHSTVTPEPYGPNSKNLWIQLQDLQDLLPPPLNKSYSEHVLWTYPTPSPKNRSLYLSGAVQIRLRTFLSFIQYNHIKYELKHFLADCRSKLSLFECIAFVRKKNIYHFFHYMIL